MQNLWFSLVLIVIVLFGIEVIRGSPQKASAAQYGTYSPGKMISKAEGNFAAKTPITFTLTAIGTAPRDLRRQESTSTESKAAIIARRDPLAEFIEPSARSGPHSGLLADSVLYLPANHRKLPRDADR
jgi:hypothetical protein